MMRKLMPTTHVPEISAENWYQKIGTGFWRICHAFGTEFFQYQFTVTNRTMLYFCAGL